MQLRIIVSLQANYGVRDLVVSMAMDLRDTGRANRVVRNQWHALEMILDVEVPRCPLHVCKIEPDLLSVLDVDPGLANLCAKFGSSSRQRTGVSKLATFSVTRFL